MIGLHTRAFARSSAKFSVRRINTVPLAFDKWEHRRINPESSPIVILHGLFGSKTNNRSVGRALARDLETTVYCLDLRNHGDSPHDPRHDYASMAADVARFLTDHKLDSHPPCVIGHSMGAKAAMALALTQPDLSSSLVAVDNGPLSIQLSPEFGKYVEGMIAVEKAHVDQQKQMFEIITPYCRELPVQQFLLSNFKRGEDNRYHCRLPLQILAKSLGNIADFDEYQPSKYVYTKPSLLIRGSRSHFVPDESLPLMGQLFPRFTVRDIDSGHWVISEKPKEFMEEVKRFLEKDE